MISIQYLLQNNLTEWPIGMVMAIPDDDKHTKHIYLEHHCFILLCKRKGHLLKLNGQHNSRMACQA